MSRKYLCLIGAHCVVLAWIVHNTSPAPAISRAEELPRQKVVLIDPGHGGNDVGAVGPSGLSEKVVTLSLAQKMKEILLETYEVHLTRDDDYAVDIEYRTAVANHYRADVFVSLHAGAGFRHQGRGSVIFYYGRSTGPASESGRQPGGPLETTEKPTPWDEIQGKHTVQAHLLAKLVHRHLMDKISPVDRGIRDAPCLVLRGADMPAILVEIAHLSHPAEEAQLRKPEVITAAAEAISTAIKEYLTNDP